ncbi:MAG: hypothetical protein WCK05_15605, partial [Planctomycetota bacterium]
MYQLTVVPAREESAGAVSLQLRGEAVQLVSGHRGKAPDDASARSGAGFGLEDKLLQDLRQSRGATLEDHEVGKTGQPVGQLALQGTQQQALLFDALARVL